MAAVDGAKYLIDHIVKKLNRIQEVFAVIGVLYTSKLSLKLAWHVLAGFRTHVWSRLRPIDLKGYGEWAVVTGSTEGIGNAYCHALARRGMNIVLISRNINKLQRVAQELESSYGVSTDIIQADFSEGQHIYQRIAASLKNKDIGVLVNNVGVMYEYPLLLEEVSEEVIWQHVLLNVGAVTMMTRLILPSMIKKNKGAIINMSSSSAINPLPMMAVYSATKIYIDYFTRAIQHECKGSGIEIQCIMPFYVATAMTQSCAVLHETKFVVPDAHTFASNALMTLGHSRRTTGYWFHGLLYVVCSAVPECVFLRLGFLLNKFLRINAEHTKRKMLSLKSK